MPVGRQFRFAAAALLTTSMIHVATSSDVDPVKQRDEQRKVQARIEQASRRASSTIDAMLFQRLSPSAEQKMLEEVADSLRGLSQDDIKTILDHLDRAVTAPDPAAADREQLQAYEKNRHVVAQLRGMLVKLDIVKNLDEAAARLDRAANDQLAVNGETLKNLNRRGRSGRGLNDVREDLSDRQAALGAEVAAVLKQIDALAPFLSPEQKDRVEKSEVKARGSRLAPDMTLTTRSIQQGNFDDAAERQRRHAKELKDLAAALRSPPGDKVAALKAARERVEKAIEAQKKVNEETAKRPEPQDKNNARQNASEAKREKAHELANAQTKAEFATRDARKTTEQAAPEVADALKPAETNQWKAEDKLRNADLDGAKEPQERALDTLLDAKDELDKQIAAAELAKKDPLAAVKNAAEQIDNLIKEQKAAAEKTHDAEKDRNKLPAAANAQKDVAKKAGELKNTPLPPNKDVKEALSKAADATKQAQAKLDDKKPADAEPNQSEAVQALEEAKAALDKQAAAIEERRAEIAKLEDAKKELDKLAAAERKLAEDAQKAGDPMKGDAQNSDPMKGDQKAGDPKDADPMKGDQKTGEPKAGDPKDADPKKGDQKASAPKNADPMKGEPKKGDANDRNAKKPDAGDLANKQAELQPPTKDAGEKLKGVAPDAAKKVAEAGMKQEGAKNDLAKNDPKAGADKASDAAKKLEEAAKDVDTQLAEKQGMEASDQAALMPNAVDPMAAAQQLAKAVEQANKAAEKANEAAKALSQQPTSGKPMPKDGKQPAGETPGIAQLQKDVAKKAADLKQSEAAKAADEAAKALEKGDLMEATQSQQKALDALNAAEANRPMNAEAPGELAATQQKLLEATKALQQSQQATNAAKAAIAQAQGSTPMAVQPQLNMANGALNMAGEQLGMGQPGQAGMSQSDAAGALQQALNALNAAAMANGQPGSQPGQNPTANAGMGMQPGTGMPPGMGQQPGMGMGQPGMGMANGMQPGMGQQPNAGQANNPGVSEGDKDGPEKLKNVASSGNQQNGDGAFIYLRKRERDKVQQNAEAQFPAEFRELIKQYNINIKNSKPAMPAAPRGNR